MYWQWEQYQASIANLESTIGTIHQSWIYTVDKKHSRKANQLRIANGGSEHAELFSAV